MVKQELSLATPQVPNADYKHLKPPNARPKLSYDPKSKINPMHPLLLQGLARIYVPLEVSAKAALYALVLLDLLLSQ